MDRKIQIITILFLVIGACIVFNFSIVAINLQPEIPEELGVQFPYSTYLVLSSCSDTESGEGFFFQTIAPRGDSHDDAIYIEIGLRNKYGDISSVDYLAKIIAPDGSIKERDGKLIGDEFSSIHYPKDDLQKGKYNIEFYVQGKKVACDAFGVR